MCLRVCRNKAKYHTLESLRSIHVGFHGSDVIRAQNTAVLLVGVCSGDAVIFQIQDV